MRAIWVYLAATPLLALTLTLLAYLGGLWLYPRSRQNLPVNSVLIAVCVIVGLLLLTETDCGTYF